MAGGPVDGFRLVTSTSGGATDLAARLIFSVIDAVVLGLMTKIRIGLNVSTEVGGLDPVILQQLV